MAFVLLGLLAAFAEARARRDEGTLVWLLIGSTAAIGAVALWWRRRYPVTVALVGIAVFAVTGLPVVAAIGLYTLAVRRRDRVLATVTVVAIATFAIRWSVDTDDSWLRLILTASLVVGFIIAVGAYVGARHDLLAALRERAERAEAEQSLRADCCWWSAARLPIATTTKALPNGVKRT